MRWSAPWNEEGLRHGGLGAVVAEVARLSMTASRRLQLAAESSSTLGIAVRRWRRQTEAADFGQPTASVTRWRVSALPSAPLPALGVGRARWLLELMRCRAGESADFEVEECDAKGLPAFSLMLALNLTSAMRVLFTIAIVLVSLSRREARETGAESVLSAIMAGGAALTFSVLDTFWPQQGEALLAMAFLGLLVVPRAFIGGHQGAVALAIPLLWVLLGTAEGSTLSKTLDWCLYSVLGVLYAV